MTERCSHPHIRTWVGWDDSEPVGMWSCAGCGHKFVPLDIAQEADAERLRAALRQVAQAHAWLAFGECRSFGADVPLLSPSDADAVARVALGEYRDGPVDAKPSDAQAFGTDLWSGIVG
jgi:hypothetical protein